MSTTSRVWRVGGGSGGGGFLFFMICICHIIRNVRSRGRKMPIILFFPSFQNLYFSRGDHHYLLLERVFKKKDGLKFFVFFFFVVYICYAMGGKNVLFSFSFLYFFPNWEAAWGLGKKEEGRKGCLPPKAATAVPS